MELRGVFGLPAFSFGGRFGPALYHRFPMGYVESNRMPNEEIYLKPRYHPIRFAPGLFGVVLGIAVAIAGHLFKESPAYHDASPVLLWLGLGLVTISLLAMGWRALVDSFDEFAITSHRVIKKTGFLKRNVRQIPLDRVQDLNVRSTLGGRWFSYGDVELQTAGSDGTIVFPRIQNPEEFRNILFIHRAPAEAGGLSARPPAPLNLEGRTSSSAESRLKEIDGLRKQGLLTEEEYQEKRRALIKEL